MKFKDQLLLPTLFLSAFAVTTSLQGLPMIDEEIFSSLKRKYTPAENSSFTAETRASQVRKEAENIDSVTQATSYSNISVAGQDLTSSETVSVDTIAKKAELFIASKNRNVVPEQVFATAKETDTTMAWNEAATAAREAVALWESVLQQLITESDSLSSSAIEEAAFQKNRWEEKAILAEVRAVVLQPHGTSENEKCNHFLDALQIAQEKTFPALLEAMDDFLYERNSTTKLAKLAMIRKPAFTALAAAITIYPELINSSMTAVTAPTSGYDYISSMALAHTSICVLSAVSPYIPASASAYACPSMLAGRFTRDRCNGAWAARPCPNSTITASASASASIYIAASAPTLAVASATAFEASDFLESIQLVFGPLSVAVSSNKDYYNSRPQEKVLIEDAKWITETAVTLARAVVLLKKEQESTNPPAWKKLEGPVVKAFKFLEKGVWKNDSWQNATIATKKLSDQWNHIVDDIKAGKETAGYSLEEACEQQKRWQQKSIYVETRTITTENMNPHEEFKKSLQEKSWPIVALFMQEFIDHPYDILRTDDIHPIEAADRADVMDLLAKDWNKI
ncbi:MAG TPA: hypothetical protein VJK54_06790, partial [Chthoniobacterales bacterium]|nr:hypothetical protein [Chthoniobacterales bacterium]